jgi:hypothetical protein
MILNIIVPKIIHDRLKESIFYVLYVIGCIPWPTVPPRKRGRPYVYSLSTVILRCFIVRICWFRLDSNNGLHTFLNMNCWYNHKLAVACGLVKIPSSRRTFDRRLKTISTMDIKQRISTMGYLFVAKGIVDTSITAIDRLHSLKSKR